MVLLAECYRDGRGVEVNRRLAKYYLRRAAERGMAVGALNLAAMAEEDGDRVAEVAALLIAERLGDSVASIELARIELGGSSRVRRERALKVLRAARRSKKEINQVLAQKYLTEGGHRQGIPRQ